MCQRKRQRERNRDQRKVEDDHERMFSATELAHEHVRSRSEQGTDQADQRAEWIEVRRSGEQETRSRDEQHAYAARDKGEKQRQAHTLTEQQHRKRRHEDRMDVLDHRGFGEGQPRQREEYRRQRGETQHTAQHQRRMRALPHGGSPARRSSA